MVKASAALIISTAISGCAQDAEEPTPAPKTTTEPADSAPATKEPESATPSDDPLAGHHLDEATIEYRPSSAKRVSRADEKAIAIVLRSTPPGATAAVDGTTLGQTPTVWNGSADSRPHDFTFTAPGYAVARYRFVPIKSGIVHGQLRRLITDKSDGGSTPE